MKFVACMTLAVLVNAAPGLAAVEQCRFIQAKADREACYQRQEAALAAKQNARASDSPRAKSVDDIALENDRLAKSLRSICRGC